MIKYPRTTHLHNPELLDFLRKRQERLGIKKPMNDKMLSFEETVRVLDQPDVKYVWESKIDGTNVAISFEDGILFLQNRGHELTSGEHPQYSLFRNWAFTVFFELQEILGDRYVLFGEWAFAVHTVVYRRLPHYFFEFDIWDKEDQCFLDTEIRQTMLVHLVKRNVLQQVPVIHVGKLSYDEAKKLVNHPSCFGEDHPEGLYLKIEKDGKTIDRYKFVRPDFVEGIIMEQDEGEDHWSHKPMVPQILSPGVDITKPLPEG